MSMKIWNIIAIIVAVLLFGLIVYVLKSRPLKTKFYHEFKQDELIRKTKTVTSDNELYFTHGQTLSYIKKYVLCKTSHDKYVICNFANNYYKIIYYIICYGKNKKPIKVIKCMESNVDHSSRIIPLSPDTKYINVVVGKVNDKVVNSDIIKPYSKHTINSYSLVTSLITFFVSFLIYYGIIYIFGGIYTKYFLSSLVNVICIGVDFLFCILIFFIRKSKLKKKNISSRLGGVVEYEFL